MKTVNLFLAGVLLLFLSAFTFSTSPFVGQYGVGCKKSDAATSSILLNVKPNGQFSYQDHSDPSKPIDVNGTWEVKNAVLVLNTNKETKFHQEWKLVDDNKFIKARKGLCWYRLGRLE